MVDAGGQMGAKPAICAAGEAPIGDFRDCICNLYCRAIGVLARCPNLTPALRGGYVSHNLVTLARYGTGRVQN